MENFTHDLPKALPNDLRVSIIENKETLGKTQK